LEKMVNKIRKGYCSFQTLKKQKGQGMVEYILIIALIAVAVVGATTALGDQVKAVLSQITSDLGTNLNP